MSLYGWTLVGLDVMLTRYNTWLQKGRVHSFGDSPLENTPKPVVVVTGATSGIGLAATQRLLTTGMHVVLAVRNTKEGEKVVQEWKDAHPGMEATARVMELDLGSLDSVRAFSKELAKAYTHVDVLVNNAGVFNMGVRERKETVDGHEMHLQVNYMSPFLLTVLLLPLLSKSKAARVVNVSSHLHVLGDLSSLENIELTRPRTYSPPAAYANSKLAQVMFTHALQQRLPEGSPITCYALHPGNVATNVTRTIPSVLQKGWQMLQFLMSMAPSEGAESTLYAAFSPSLDKAKGQYIAYCAQVPSSPLARDKAACDRLWDWTCDTLKLQRDLKL